MAWRESYFLIYARQINTLANGEIVVQQYDSQCFIQHTVMIQLFGLYSLENISRDVSMAVPTYDKFIEPVLRFLATKPEGVPARDAHEAAADMLGLDDNQRAVMIASGQKTELAGRMIA